VLQHFKNIQGKNSSYFSNSVAHQVLQRLNRYQQEACQGIETMVFDVGISDVLPHGNVNRATSGSFCRCDGKLFQPMTLEQSRRRTMKNGLRNKLRSPLLIKGLRV